MDLLSSTFKKRFYELEGVSAFKKKANVYYRVINDVMQNIVLTKYYGQRECTLEFSITPLCYGIEYIDAVSYYIKEFESQSALINFRTWNYDRYSEESTSSVVDQMIYYIKKHLIPFFEKATDCQKSLSAIIELEKSFHRNWIQTAINSGETINTVHTSSVNYYDYRILCMALKAHNTEIATKCLLCLLQNTTLAMDKNKHFASEAKIEKYKKRLIWLNQAIESIKQDNYSFFDSKLAEGEYISQKTLKIK